MRSRDLRTFTVEVKNKRRHAPPAPASLWADAEALLKPAATNDHGPGAGEPIQVRRAPSAGNGKSDQSRRVLPDLRPSKPETDAAAGSDPVAQAANGADAAAKADGAMNGGAPRRGRGAIAPDPDTRPKRAARRPVPAGVAPLPAAEPAAGPIVVETAAAADTSARSPVAGDTPIIVPGETAKPARRWARRVEDLPRGERWKRRLPDVCR